MIMKSTVVHSMQDIVPHSKRLAAGQSVARLILGRIIDVMRANVSQEVPL